MMKNIIIWRRKTKISLARALIKSASVIILDEPFRNLDNETRDNLRDYILNTKRSLLYNYNS